MQVYIPEGHDERCSMPYDTTQTAYIPSTIPIQCDRKIYTPPRLRFPKRNSAACAKTAKPLLASCVIGIFSANQDDQILPYGCMVQVLRMVPVQPGPNRCRHHYSGITVFMTSLIARYLFFYLVNEY